MPNSGVARHNGDEMNKRCHQAGFCCVCAGMAAGLALSAGAATVPVRSRAQPARTPAAPAVAVHADPASRSNDFTSFERYAGILARKPFGDETAAEAAAAAAAAQAAPVDSFTKSLKMCAITRNHLNGRIQVGLVDSVTRKNYFLYEGDAEDGVELKKADYENEKALLKKGTEEVWMGMADIKTAQVVAGPGGAVAFTPPGSSRNAPAPGSAVSQKPQLTGEALQQHLKSYQMELIRAGGKKGPPLPLELTPEMDAQLVKEGVLPPSE